jgi:2-succinyl-6-hydroxy-2,4-cyclohexadiene-1-carboxylate synthase
LNQHLQIRGVEYRVQVVGEGAPLLLLHGFTGSSDVFEPFFAKWQSHFRCIVPDLLGHGMTDAPSDPKRYTMAETVADLAEILDVLAVSEVSVLGYSMGGRIALGFALEKRARVHRLVLEGASPGLHTASEQQKRQMADEALAKTICEGGVASFVQTWEEIPLFASQKRLPDAVFARQRRIRLAQRKEGLAASLVGMGTGRQPSYWSALTTFDVPTLLITGELDSKFTNLNANMAERMAAAQHVVMADAGHTPHLEQPAAFEQLAYDFLLDSIERAT